MRLVRFALPVLAAIALVTVTGGTADAFEVLLPWAPLLVVGGLLLTRRFVGESRILARLARRVRSRRSHAQPRWSRLRERALTSLHALTTQHLRGPPARLTA